MSSRTSGPTMTRAPAALALAKAARTSPSPCAITTGFALAAVGRGEESGLHRLGGAAERRGGERQHEHDGARLRGRVRARRRFDARGRRPATRRAGTARLPAEIARRTMRAVRTRRRARTRHARHRAPPRAFSERREAIIRAESNFAWTKGAEAAGADGAAAGRLRAAPGTLYVVATPLGNLRDLTLRALDILGSADVIAAEDTRVTGVLLRHFGIATRPISLHEHNEAARAASIVRELARGPQRRAGQRCRHAGDQRSRRAARARGARGGISGGADSRRVRGDRRGVGRRASPPSASCSWASCPPRRRRGASLLASVARASGRARDLRGAASRRARRWRQLAAALGGERSLVVAREITKKFETIAQMTLAEASAWFAADPNRERGEFVLLVDAPASRTRRAARPRSTSTACSRRSSSSCRRRAPRASRRRRPACRATRSTRRRWR